MLYLQTLGALDLRTTDGRVLHSLVAQPKTVAVLVHLALARPRGFQRRDKLCALFWPESDDEHARAALSQALSRIRRGAGGSLVENRGSNEIRVAPGRLECDAIGFEEAVAAGDPASALSLYRGPLLDGFHLDGEPEFERWLDVERQRLHELAASAARALALQRLEAGALLEAEQWVERALDLDPVREEGVAELVGALADAGDPVGALRVYERWSRILDQTLEIAPSKEIRGLVDRIRRSTAAPPASAIGPPVSRRRGDRVPASTEATQTPRSRRGRRHQVAVGAAALVLVLLAGLLWVEVDRPAKVSSWVAPRGSSGAGFSPGDWFIAATFTAPDSSSGIALAFQTLLIRDLEAAGYSTVVGGLGALSRRKLEDALVRMRMPPDTLLDAELACRVAEREGAAGVLAGSVLPLGDAYVMSAVVLRRDSCDPVIRASVVAPSAAVWPHVAELSRELRGRLGETRESIRGGPALLPVTTSYIEALRAVQPSADPEDWQDPSRVEARVLEALELEPDFAYGHLRLAGLYNLGGRFDEAAPHIERAYELREQLPRIERLAIEGVYQQSIQSDPARSLATFEAILESAPHLADVLLNQIAVTAAWSGDWDRMLSLSLELLEQWPESPSVWFAYGNGLAAAEALGRTELADTLFHRALRTADTLGVEVSPLVVLDRHLYRRDWASADAYCHSRPEVLDCAAYQLMRGRLSVAEKVFERFARVEQGGPTLTTYMGATGRAEIAWLRGRPDSAWRWLATADSVRPLASLPRVEGHVDRFLFCAAAIRFGDPDQFPECHVETEDPERWDADGSYHWVLRAGAWSRRLLALRAAAAGDGQAATRHVRGAVRSNFGTPGLVDQLILGLANEARSRPDSALDHYVAATRLELNCFSCFPTGPTLFALHLAPTHERIALLAESVGDTTTAVEHYAALADLWSDADPVLRPRVRASLMRIHALRRR